MKLIIETQYRENYGFPEGHVGADAYWKFKGGSEYFVRVTLEQINRARNVENLLERIVDEVRSQIEYHNDASEEYIIGWSLEDDDYISESEKFELEYEGKIHYPIKELHICPVTQRIDAIAS